MESTHPGLTAIRTFHEPFASLLVEMRAIDVLVEVEVLPLPFQTVYMLEIAPNLRPTGIALRISELVVQLLLKELVDW